jgi:hypothetical protein
MRLKLARKSTAHSACVRSVKQLFGQKKVAAAGEVAGALGAVPCRRSKGTHSLVILIAGYIHADARRHARRNDSVVRYSDPFA